MQNNYLLFPITSTKHEWKMDVYIHIIFGNLKRKKYTMYNDYLFSSCK